MLKLAVIGVGNMGKHHARIYSEIPSVELSSVADLDENTGTEIAKKYYTKYYKNYQEMLDSENLDIVSICVPTFLHFEVASFCLSKKINVLLEKPITSGINDGRKLLKLANKNKLKFLVGHIERYNPAIRRVKEMITKGQLGRIIAITIRRLGGFPPQIRDSDIATDLAIHDIDISNYLLEELPQEVYVNKQRNHIQNRDDSVEFFLKYKNASSYIQTNWISPVKIRKINITGTEGYLEMDYISQKIEFYQSNYDKFIEASKGFSDYILMFSEPDVINISVAKKEPLKEEILYFINCVKNNIKIDSTFALEALKIALKK